MSFMTLNLALDKVKFAEDFKSSNKEMCNVKELIEDITRMLARDIEREKIDEEILKVVINICSYVGRMLQRNQGEAACREEAVAVVTECFRTLRNSCAGCQRNQDIIHRNEHIIEDIHDVFDWCINLETNLNETSTDFQESQVFVMLRCGMQLLGNLCTNHTANQTRIWQQFSHLFRSILKMGDRGLSRYCCMVIHACLTPDRLVELISTKDGAELTHAVLAHMVKEGSEWGLYITERLLLHPLFMSKFFDALGIYEKHLVLDTSMLVIDNSTMEGANTLDQNTVIFLSEQFEEKAHIILGLHSGEVEKMEPPLVVKLLELLCMASSNPIYNTIIQERDGLIKSTINLLHCIQVIGKEAGNTFSCVTKLSSCENVDSANPAFGLKKNLIRLIANLAHQNKANQDKIRDLGGIALILNNTNIDRRNPYITQWAIFAVRNLLEDNLTNQSMVADMNLDCLADNVSLLEEFGVEAVIRDGKVVVTGTNKPKAETTSTVIN